jgi:hypothetical protein
MKPWQDPAEHRAYASLSRQNAQADFAAGRHTNCGPEFVAYADEYGRLQQQKRQDEATRKLQAPPPLPVLPPPIAPIRDTYKLNIPPPRKFP